MFTKGKLGEKDWLTPHSCAWTTERECVCGVCVWERELRERETCFFFGSCVKKQSEVEYFSSCLLMLVSVGISETRF